MSSPFVDLDGIPIPGNEVLGYGRTGIVVRRQDTAVKMPIRYSYSTDDDVASNTEVIRREQDVYRRLGQCEGVVPCISFSETSIQLALMENGDLRTYLTKSRPSKPLQLSWFRDMASALARIHDHGIIVADIASRNFLVAGDLSIKFCDFTESSLMPLTINMETVDDCGYSIQTDIGQLGAVIYEVVTGSRCDFDLFKDLPLDAGEATWPQRSVLPSTENVWLGSIIDKCWTKGAYKNARGLLEALEGVHCQSSASNDGGKDFSIWKKKIPAGQYLSINLEYEVTLQYIVPFVTTVATITLLTAGFWRRS